MKQLEELITISRQYGEDPDYVIAGGGNTSCKDAEKLWIKASGVSLKGIDRSGFVCMDRAKLSRIERASFSSDASLREEEVKKAMQEAVIAPEQLRPSVETSLHNLIEYTFVVHTHPTRVNGLMCSRDVEQEVAARFGFMALLVEYTDPGYILFKKLQKRLASYKAEHGASPKIIFLQNHGVFVAADTTAEIDRLYATIDQKISAGKNMHLPPAMTIEASFPVAEAVADFFRPRSLLTCSVTSELIRHFTISREAMSRVSLPFSPDIIVYCKSAYLLLDARTTAEEVPAELEAFQKAHGFWPKVILKEGGGLILVEENEKSLLRVEQIYLELMKISYLSDQFGGPHFMSPEQIAFIDSWEVEHYRQQVAKKTGA